MPAMNSPPSNGRGGIRARHCWHRSYYRSLLATGTYRWGPYAVPAPRGGAHGRWLPSCRVALPMELSKNPGQGRAGGRWSRRASPWNKAAACGQARAGQGQAGKGEIRSRLFAEWIGLAAGGGFLAAKNLWRIWTGLAPDGKARAIPLACSERRAG